MDFPTVSPLIQDLIVTRTAPDNLKLSVAR